MRGAMDKFNEMILPSLVKRKTFSNDVLAEAADSALKAVVYYSAPLVVLSVLYEALKEDQVANVCAETVRVII